MRASTRRTSISSIAVVLALLYAPAAFAQAPTDTEVTTAPGTSRIGETVTMTARVSVPGSPEARPTGTVQFEVDGTTVGAAVTVQDAVATLPTAAMAAGPHTVTARYVSDDAAFANSSGMVAHAVGK